MTVHQFKPIAPAPEPRSYKRDDIWDAERLAAFFGFKKDWILDMKDDPPPRMPGCKHPRYDMAGEPMKAWMRRMGCE